ncbi:hypothetical protein DSO57_1006630 [Entomophthora muscae]|uniref:Uncharacterized protein n=1 Tax=Entomophthora muscae TaxID=34485 RepID=A0ACC2T7Z6_9FUNG|nr:hypothetical protein DSO57_1006630 [Entomophthora muscae]
MNLWFTNLFSYLFLILLHLHIPKPQYTSTGIDSQTPVDKTKAFDYYHPPNAPFGPVHFTEYPANPDHKPWILEELHTTILLPTWSPWNRPNTQTNHLNTPTSDATGQSSQFLGVLYLALTGLIDSALPAAGPWAVAGKALSYLVNLGPIIWCAMPVSALTPSSPAGAPQYSWYPKKSQGPELSTMILYHSRHSNVEYSKQLSGRGLSSSGGFHWEFGSHD